MDTQKKRLYQFKAQIMKALAHPLRLEIVDILRSGERCVSDIVRETNSEQSNISRHLALLTAAGILISRKVGLKVYYRLKTPCVLDFFYCLERVLIEDMKEKKELLEE